MKKIVIASKNPVKINSTLSGFQKMFPEEKFEIESVNVPSGVNDQPKDDSETLLGAKNRVDNAQRETDADFWIGIEGGIEEKEFGMEAFAWVVIKSKDGQVGRGRTGTFFLPPEIASLIKQGKELGEADNIVFKRENTKQENGAVGILTKDTMTRTKYYEDAVILALIPFRNPDLF